MAGEGQKSEKPTQQKLQKARKEGRFPVSRDLLAALQFLTLYAVMLNMFAPSTDKLEGLFSNFFLRAANPAELTQIDFVNMYRAIVFPFFLPLLGAGLGVVAILTLLQLATVQFGLATKQLMPDLKRLNPMSKLSHLPKDNAVNVLRSIIFIFVIAVLVYSLMAQRMQELSTAAASSLGSELSSATLLVRRLLGQLGMVLLLFGVVDFVRQRMKHTGSLRMSKQDIKDEQKDVEGNQQMKMRIRRLQRDAMRRNMLKAVAKATVVIVNPTHYAIALSYEMGTRTIPTVVAKGRNHLALMMKQRAKEHDVPVIENKLLAQALYQAVEIGNEIPPTLYRAVAEVLAQIYRILNRQ